MYRWAGESHIYSLLGSTPSANDDAEEWNPSRRRKWPSLIAIITAVSILLATYFAIQSTLCFKCTVSRTSSTVAYSAASTFAEVVAPETRASSSFLPETRSQPTQNQRRNHTQPVPSTVLDSFTNGSSSNTLVPVRQAQPQRSKKSSSSITSQQRLDSPLLLPHIAHAPSTSLPHLTCLPSPDMLVHIISEATNAHTFSSSSANASSEAIDGSAPASFTDQLAFGVSFQWQGANTQANSAHLSASYNLAVHQTSATTTPSSSSSSSPPYTKTTVVVRQRAPAEAQQAQQAASDPTSTLKEDVKRAIAAARFAPHNEYVPEEGGPEAVRCVVRIQTLSQETQRSTEPPRRATPGQGSSQVDQSGTAARPRRHASSLAIYESISEPFPTTFEPPSEVFPLSMRTFQTTPMAPAHQPQCIPRDSSLAPAVSGKYLFFDLRRGGFNTQLQSVLWALAAAAALRRSLVEPVIVQQENFYFPDEKYSPSTFMGFSAWKKDDVVNRTSASSASVSVPVDVDDFPSSEQLASESSTPGHPELLHPPSSSAVSSSSISSSSTPASQPVFNSRANPPPNAPISFFLSLPELVQAYSALASQQVDSPKGGSAGSTVGNITTLRPPLVSLGAFMQDCSYPSVCVDAISHAYYGPFHRRPRGYTYPGFLRTELDQAITGMAKGEGGAATGAIATSPSVGGLQGSASGTMFLKPRRFGDLSTYPACAKIEGRDTVLQVPGVSFGPWNDWSQGSEVVGHQGHSAAQSLSYRNAFSHIVPAARWFSFARHVFRTFSRLSAPSTCLPQGFGAARTTVFPQLKDLPSNYIAVHIRRGNFVNEIRICQTAPERDPKRCRRGVNSILPSDDHVLQSIRRADDLLASKMGDLLRIALPQQNGSNMCVVSKNGTVQLPIFIMTTVDALPSVVNLIEQAFPGRVVINLYEHGREFLQRLPQAYRTDYALEMVEKVISSHALVFVGNLFSSISSTVYSWRQAAQVDPAFTMAM